ncbi:hypothetical protein AKJ57_01490 [candidate division MSBL1 archaeon SCGC-AAA259A05]|uniref:Gfo/Idh/MocA-like oxidoreductase N-terminal domain-containing protein n=1 Tax=candidate division MSBL1 archaeon SCGC-AAA259A05 TaxID=1698259 RepID=A0A133UB50_9EURY|nr:hypothetical protein AKJ57_01490 [candidate division MSBL1 archaeon SCGC-AAA259A05]
MTIPSKSKDIPLQREVFKNSQVRRLNGGPKMTKTDERLRTAIVGLGWVGTHQGRAIAEHPRGEVTAVCDLSEEQMKKFAEELEGNPKFW